MVAKQVSSTATKPWNGCSTTGGEFNFSATCRNVGNYKTYFECKDARMFLGARNSEAWWYCSSLLAGGSWPGRSIRSPNSSDQDVGNSPYRPLAVLSDVRVGSNSEV